MENEYVCKLYPFQTGAEVEEVREEIIRCCECKHLADEPKYEYTWGEKEYECLYHESFISVQDGEQINGFCSWGEREDAETH